MENDNFASTPAQADKVDETVNVPSNIDTTDNSSSGGPVEDKFEGKDVSEVVKAYNELEKKLGKQSEEMGQLRKSFDDGVLTLLKQQQQPEKQPDPYLNEEQLSEALLDDPKKAVLEIKRQIRDEVLGEVRNASAANKAEEQLLKKHADKDQILESANFQNWVKTNVPPELARMSDNQESQGNSEILSFLLDSYKKSSDISGNGNGNESFGVNPAKLAAPVPGMSSKPSSSNILTRVELAKMSPEEYARRNDEILEAYRTGRVK